MSKDLLQRRSGVIAAGGKAHSGRPPADIFYLNPSGLVSPDGTDLRGCRRTHAAVTTLHPGFMVARPGIPRSTHRIRRCIGRPEVVIVA
jgi:hypothetical protein